MNREGLFESVPNFSEGQRADVIAEIASAASARSHVLDVDPDPDHHRVVISLAALAGALLDGVIAAVGTAVAVARRTRLSSGLSSEASLRPIPPWAAAVPTGRSRLSRALEQLRCDMADRDV